MGGRLRRIAEGLRPMLKIGRVQEPLEGYGDAIGIAEVVIPVGVGQALGFHEGANALGLRRPFGHAMIVEVRNHDLHGPGGRGRRRADGQGPPGTAHHRPGDGLVIRHIFQGQGATQGRRLGAGHNGLSDGPGIESRRALGGDALQRFRVGEIAHRRPRRKGLTAGEEVLRGAGVFINAGYGGEALEGAGHLGGHRKARLGEANGRAEDRGPGQLAVAIVGQLIERHGAGDAHGPAALPGLDIVHGRFVLHEHIDPRPRRRLLPAIEEGEVLGLRIEDQHETAAPEPRAFRLHEPQHGMGGNGRVHRVAALGEHLRRGRRGIGIGHRGHPTMRPGGRCFRPGGRIRLSLATPGKQPKTQHKGKGTAHGHLLQKRKSRRGRKG